MSADVVVEGRVRTCEDLAELIQKWLAVAEPIERLKFSAFVEGFAETTSKNKEEDDDHSGGR